MTEDEWMRCDHPIRAIQPFGPFLTTRKPRLFAVACCRRIEHLVLRFKGAWRAVVLAERIADGEPVSEEANRLRSRLAGSAFCWIDGYREEKENNVMWNVGDAAAGCLGCVRGELSSDRLMAFELISVAMRTASAAGHWARRTDRERVQQRWVDAEHAAQMPLFRCVFGNPFRPVAFSPEWRTDTAVALARQMHEAREFSAMPILADALQDAGCDCAEILDHCRGPGPHVRGCFVVDLVLAKE